MLCAHCLHSAFKSRQKTSHEFLVHGEKIKTFSLFEWVPQKNNALSSLMISLKGQAPQHIWSYYAEHFLQYRLSISDLPGKGVLVPCPSRNSEPDHAFLFALALSELAGLQIICPLKMQSETQPFRKQSKKSRLGSIRERFFRSENFTRTHLDGRDIIFVDDVITTGSTARAAYSLLAPCTASFEAWSLSRRTMSN